jgi:PAS domain S-box-containing protein
MPSKKNDASVFAAEADYAKLNRTYAFLSDINQAIVRIREPQKLYEAACRIAVERGGFRLAWIGCLDGDTGWVRPAAQAGFPEDYLEKLDLNLNEEQTKYGPLATALQNGKHIVINNIATDQRMLKWREGALLLGFQSSATFPIILEGQAACTLNLFSAEAGFFDEAELKLLDEMAGDIAFAVEFAGKEEARRRAEDLLRQSEKRYETLAMISPVGIFRTEPSGSTTYVNPKWCAISGLPAEKALGDGWLEAVHPEDREKVIKGWQISTHTQKASYSDYRFIRPSGEIAWVMGQAVPELDPEGRVVGYVGTITDITERKQSEQEIHRLNAELELRVKQRTAQLEAANKELEAFSYSVSHDLRAPLRAISGFSEIISRRHRANLNEEGRHYVDNIVKASERMGQLIDDLLTYARLGRTGVRHEPVALDDLFADINKNMKTHLQETQGTLIIQAGFPTIPGDRTLLALIFMNLVENGLKYHQKDVPPRVSLTHDISDGSLVIRVRDNGIGIPLEHQEKVFNVFQRLHSEDEYPGTGIGLATVRKSVELLGGSIGLESKPGEGSTFIIYINME